MKLIDDATLNLLCAAGDEVSRMWHGAAAKETVTTLFRGLFESSEKDSLENAQKYAAAVKAARESRPAGAPLSPGSLFQTEIEARGMCLDDALAVLNWSKLEFELFITGALPLDERKAAQLGRMFNLTGAIFLATEAAYRPTAPVTKREEELVKEEPVVA